MENTNETIKLLANQKGITEESVIASLEAAVLLAARNKFGYERNIEVQYNKQYQEVEIFEFLKVVDVVKNEDGEIAISYAKKLDEECKLGDEIGVKIDNSELGRIPAHIAKKAIKNRISNEERQKIYSNFSHRKGEIITGTIVRVEVDNIVLDLGTVEGAIPKRFQSPNDKYKVGEKMQTYIANVNNSESEYQIILSRTHSEFVAELLKNEVPEMQDETIQILYAVREAGNRTKIAVISKNKNVDAVSTTIGFAGFRIKSVKREIFGERIDVVYYDEDPAKFACNSLFPVVIEKVLLDTYNRKMDITVPDDQSALAIGKNGSNIRLCSQLVGWKINIISKSQDEKDRAESYAHLKQMNFLNDLRIQTLYNFGIRSLEDIKNINLDYIKNIPNVGEDIAKKMKNFVNEQT